MSDRYPLRERTMGPSPTVPTVRVPARTGTLWHTLGRIAPFQAFGVLLGLLWADPADACSPSPAYPVGQTHPTVPANGGPILTYRCTPEDPFCEWEGELVVLRDGEEVPGTFSHHNSDYTFIPDEPLVVGAVYTVPEFGEVTAVEPVPVDLSSVAVDVTLTTPGEGPLPPKVCCSHPLDSCGRLQCWSTEAVERTYSLALYVGEVHATGEAQRTEVRASWTTSGGDSGETEWANVAHEIPLAEAASEYCVVPQLRSLVTGETRTLDETCLDHGDLPTPGETRVTVPGVETGDLAICPVPVEGYLAKWCEDTQRKCDEGLSVSCESVLEECSGVELGSGGTSGSPLNGEAGMGGSDLGSGDDEEGGGLCSVTRPGRGAIGVPGSLALAVLLALVRRRRLRSAVS